MSESENTIEDVVGAINHAGELFRILSHGPVDETEIVDSLDGSFQDYIHRHDPWDRSFVIWWDGEPAFVVGEARDMFIVSPEPRESTVERQNIYAEKTGGKRGLIPRLRLERAGNEAASVELVPYPVEAEEHLFRLVSDEAVPVPDLTLQTWDHGIEEPAIDAERYFERGDRVRVLETGQVGTVEGCGGRMVAVNPEDTEEYELNRYPPDELEDATEAGSDE